MSNNYAYEHKLRLIFPIGRMYNELFHFFYLTTLIRICCKVSERWREIIFISANWGRRKLGFHWNFFFSETVTLWDELIFSNLVWRIVKAKVDKILKMWFEVSTLSLSFTDRTFLNQRFVKEGIIIAFLPSVIVVIKGKWSMEQAGI